MKNYYFSDEINDSSARELLRWMGETDKGTIYFSSNGGMDRPSFSLIHALNSRKEDFALVGTCYLYSNGFFIFFSFRGSREILDGVTGSYHQGYRETQIRMDGKVRDETEKMWLDNLKGQHEGEERWLKALGLKEKEMQKWRKGEEVLFSNARMRELLLKQKQIL